MAFKLTPGGKEFDPFKLYTCVKVTFLKNKTLQIGIQRIKSQENCHLSGKQYQCNYVFFEHLFYVRFSSFKIESLDQRYNLYIKTTKSGQMK